MIENDCPPNVVNTILSPDTDTDSIAFVASVETVANGTVMSDRTVPLGAVNCTLLEPVARLAP